MNQVQYCNSFGGMPKHSCLAFLIFFSRKNLRALFRKMWLLIIQHPIIDTVSINSWSSWMSPGDISKTYSWWTLLQSRTNFDSFQCGESWGGKIGPLLYTRSTMNLGVSATNDRCSVDKEHNIHFLVWTEYFDCILRESPPF